MSLADGLISTVAEGSGINVLLGGTWSSSERIVYVRDSTLWVMPETGGEAKALTTLDAARAEIAHLSPIALPDGNAVLFTIRRDGGKTNDVGMVDLPTGARTLVLERAASPMYAGSGHLVFVRDGALLAVPFDADERKVSGSPVRLEERMPGGDEAAIAISSTGSLVYSTTAADAYRLVSVSRLGVETPFNDTPRAYVRSRFSRDGRFLAIQIDDDLWVQDLSRRTFERVTGSENTSYFTWNSNGNLLVLGTTAGIRWVGTCRFQPARGAGWYERFRCADVGRSGRSHADFHALRIGIGRHLHDTAEERRGVSAPRQDAGLRGWRAILARWKMDGVCVPGVWAGAGLPSRVSGTRSEVASSQPLVEHSLSGIPTGKKSFIVTVTG